MACKYEYLSSPTNFGRELFIFHGDGKKILLTQHHVQRDDVRNDVIFIIKNKKYQSRGKLTQNSRKNIDFWLV